MEITEEMRRAVYAEDCARDGHLMAVDQAISVDPLNGGGMQVRSMQLGRLPHLSCRRCEQVWPLMPDIVAFSYEEAEAALLGRLNPSDPLLAALAADKEAAKTATPVSLGTGHGHGH